MVAIDSHERAKSYPDRYPVNSDSIGIELVGKHLNDTDYETVTVKQTASLKLLLSVLHELFETDSKDIYTHPEVSYKHPGEASTAVW